MSKSKTDGQPNTEAFRDKWDRAIANIGTKNAPKKKPSESTEIIAALHVYPHAGITKVFVYQNGKRFQLDLDEQAQ